MGKFDNTEIQRECKTASFKISRTQEYLSMMMVGRKVKILSDFNGQPYGTSKKSLKGKILTVKMVTANYADVQVLLEGEKLFIPVEEVEFMEDGKCGQ